MRKTVSFLIVFLLVFLYSFETSAQVDKDEESKSEKSSLTIKKSQIRVSDEVKKNQDLIGERQQQFSSPFRYIIFSNLTEEDLDLDIPQRRLEILMDKKAFSLKHLKLLFSLQANRFPLPIRLEIRVHTSLATIETPEEMETMSDHTSREKYYDYNKTALYFRDDDGVESITYRYGSPPGFWEKIIILPRPQQTK